MSRSDPLDYPFEDVPAPTEPTHVAPGVAWVRMPLPFALDHINLWMLDDGDDVVLVDTGFGTDETRAHWTRILEADGRRISGVVVTHFHPDHLGLAAWIAARDEATVFMTEAEYLEALALWHQLPGHCVADMVAFFRTHGLPEARLAALEARGNTYRRGVPELPRTHRRIFHGDRLTIGGRQWRVIVGHGHAPEHASLYCAEDGVLISGDMLLPRISTNVSVQASAPLDDALGCFLLSLQRIIDLPNDTLVLPSHGKPFRGIRARIEQLEAHHAERCTAVLQALDRPMSAGDLLPVLFPRELDNHQVMFAMGEAVAHLNHLAQRSLVERVSGDDGTIRFARRHRN
ncbi:MAG: MBL fold metallo-hydrolase [Azoarcus sp.]|nr:MBL fold metallo-hydrolase [Azoarcus sp.]